MKTYTVYERDSGLICGTFTEHQLNALGIKLDHFLVRVNEICPQTVQAIKVTRDSLKDIHFITDEEVFK